jgi:hypothetical protein
VGLEYFYDEPPLSSGFSIASKMPSTTDQPKKAKVIKSAFDSETFDTDVTIRVDGLVGSATISPSGRDVALAS